MFDPRGVPAALLISRSRRSFGAVACFSVLVACGGRTQLRVAISDAAITATQPCSGDGGFPVVDWCAGFSGKPCPGALPCVIHGCGSDMEGFCAGACPADGCFPVCGCDGHTYASACAAATAAMPISGDHVCQH